MRKRIVVSALAFLAVPALAGCGGPDAAEDEAAITDVLVENEIGGPDRCTSIYTDDYLAENWNENVTFYGGGTPLEKCENTPPTEGVTEDDIEVTVESVDGDAAVASSRVRAEEPVGFNLIRDGDAWRIDGFTD